MALAHRVDLRQANRIRMAGRRPVRVIMAISCRRARSGDLELNWGRIGHVTRKRMRHPCNLLANIIRTSWPTRWPGSPDLANFLRIGQRRCTCTLEITPSTAGSKLCECLADLLP